METNSVHAKRSCVLAAIKILEKRKKTSIWIQNSIRIGTLQRRAVHTAKTKKSHFNQRVRKSDGVGRPHACFLPPVGCPPHTECQPIDPT